MQRHAFVLRLLPSLVKDLDALAAVEGLSRNALIQNALVEYVELTRSYAKRWPESGAAKALGASRPGEARPSDVQAPARG